MGEHLFFENSWGAFTVASRGASLLSLRIGGRELFHDFGNQWQDWASGAVMFPFPVRMSSGTVMKFEGVDYHWPINDEKHRAALHGFTPWEEFELAQLSNGVQASWTYDGAKDFYPFPCKLTITYILSQEGLSLSCRVQNSGTTNLPYHMGWHPYFKTNAPALNPVPAHRLKKNELSHPGEKIPFEGFDWTEEVDGAFFMDSIEHGDTTIQPLSTITQIFRPAGGAPFVAIEPITGLGHPDFPWRTVAPGGVDEVVTAIRLMRR